MVKLSHRHERRAEERRDSIRVPARLTIRQVGGGTERMALHAGDLSLNGVCWRTVMPPTDELVEVSFRLPGLLEPARAVARVVNRASGGDETILVHAVFVDMDVRHQLALARHLER